VILPPRENITIITQTTNITNVVVRNNIIVNEGPDYNVIVRQTSQPIRRLKLERQTDHRHGRQIDSGRRIPKQDPRRHPCHAGAAIPSGHRSRYHRSEEGRASRGGSRNQPWLERCGRRPEGGVFPNKLQPRPSRRPIYRQ
jgi:hypothetical protein